MIAICYISALVMESAVISSIEDEVNNVRYWDLDEVNFFNVRFYRTLNAFIFFAIEENTYFNHWDTPLPLVLVAALSLRRLFS